MSIQSPNRIFCAAIMTGCLLLGNILMAQNPTHRSSKTETDEQYTQDIGWLLTPFSDNWFLQVEGGGNIYYGFEDRLGMFSDRITSSIAMNLGHWIFPMLGIRAGASYGQMHGFISRESYAQYSPTYYGEGWQEYYRKQNGDVDHLHGHYWFYDKNDKLYMQKWEYISANLDVILNINFKRQKAIQTYGYLGIGLNTGITEDAINPFSGYVESKWANDPNRAIDVHGGLIGQVQLNRHFNIYGDLRFTMYEGKFDREVIEAVEHGLRFEDYGLQARLGVGYKFHFSRPETRLAWYRQHIDNSVTDITQVPDYVYATHQVKFNTVTYIDTIFIYDTLTKYSTKFDSIAILRSRKYAQQAIVNQKSDFDQHYNNYSLDDILNRHLLPYEIVFFEIGKNEVRSSESIKIAKMAALMKALPDYRFLIIGSSDAATGSAEHNQELSTLRSEAVYKILTSEYGIRPAQLQRIYMGGIRDFKPYELNRATVIIMYHPKVIEEFNKLSDTYGK